MYKRQRNGCLLDCIAPASFRTHCHGDRRSADRQSRDIPGLSESTRLHVETFWELIDEILNSILFLLIGLKIIFLLQHSSYGINYPALISLFVAITLLSIIARYLAIALPVKIRSLMSEVNPGTVPILTWAGIRGGVSVALALSLPNSPESTLLLFVTYLVVLFSVIVQGLTIENLIKYYYP
mgnify:CR=1 FL=1